MTAAQMVFSSALDQQTIRSEECGERRYVHHPYLVLRVAGLPFSMAERLSSGIERRLLDRLREAQIEAGELIQRACNALEHGVSLQSFDQPERRGLLKSKRSLYNNRLSGLRTEHRLLGLLGEESAAAIAAADGALAEIARLEGEFNESFSSESATARARLRSLCKEDENFLKGVAFSAPALISELRGAEGDAEKYSGKRGRNLDMALFNYFMRATTKVSPLTYFTPTLAAKLRDEPGVRFTLDGRGVGSSVEMSRHMLSHVLAGPGRSLKFWGDGHPLELNATAVIEGAFVQFRDMWAQGSANGSTWGVRQPRARLPVNEKIRALVDFFQRAGPGCSFSLRDLFSGLGRHVPFEAQPNAFGAYVAQAVRVGLLLPVLELYEQEDVSAYLGSLLKARAPEAAASLAQLEAELALYSRASAATRLTQSVRIEEAFEGLCAKAGAGPMADRKASLFHEDCAFDGGTPEVPVQMMGTALEDLHRLSELFPLLDYNHIVQCVTAGLFLQRHGGGMEILVGESAEAIAAEAQAIALRLTPLPLAQQEDEIGRYSGHAQALLRGKRLLLHAIRELMVGGKDVVLDEDFVERFAALAPEPVRRRATSYTVIGQSDEDEDGGDPLFIVNRLYSGHSMLMSRFMRGQDARGVGEITHYLEELAGGAQPTEIPGVFGFNANLHPQFAGAELSLPGRRPHYSQTTKIPLGDVSMRYDSELDRLTFMSSSVGDLSLQYFGFLNLMALPGLYQLLGRTSLQGLILDLWQDLYFAGMIPPDSVTILPRVSYRSVVLSRRSLFIPAAKLPSSELPEVEFFGALHGLLRGLGETGDHFVRMVASRDDFFSSDPEGRANMAGTTDFKPAYLSLNLPLSVSSFKRRLQRRARSVLIQEALPGIGRGGVMWNGSRHACELQFEVSRTRAQ